MLSFVFVERKSNLSGVLFFAAVLKFCLPPVFVLGLLEFGGQAEKADKSENWDSNPDWLEVKGGGFLLGGGFLPVLPR